MIYKKVFIKILIIIIFISGWYTTHAYGTPLYTVKRHKDFLNSSKVYIIQDLHADSKTQLTIYSIIHQLIKQHPSPQTFIYREGAVGNIPIRWFKTYPNQKTKTIIAKHFIKIGKISGAGYTAIIENTPCILLGIDDTTLYKSSITLLKNNVKNAPLNKEYTEHLYNAIATLIMQSENTTLQKLLILQTESTKQNILKYYTQIYDIFITFDSNIPPSSPLAKLSHAYKRIHSIDDENIQQQKLILLKTLSTVENIDVHSLFQNNNKIQRQLVTDYRKHSFNEKPIQDLIDYLDSRDTIDHIQADQLEQNIFSTAQDIISQFSKSKKHTDLFTLLMIAPLIQHYFECTLTRSEYDFLYSNLTEKFTLDITEKYPQLKQLNHLYTDLHSNNFYRITKQRDTIIAKNVSESIINNPDSLHILVVGGFHTQGITKYFTDEAISFDVLAPHITNTINTYSNTYHTLLGISNTAETAISIDMLNSITKEYPLGIQNLAIPTYLKHILSDTANKNFVLETQFLMQALDRFTYGHDVSITQYPYKQMSFLQPILINGERLFPVLFDDSTLPPLFVNISHNANALPIIKVAVLHHDIISDLHISVIGPHELKQILITPYTSASLEPIPYAIRQELTEKIAPYIQHYSGLKHTVETLFTKFDPFILMRGYSVDTPPSTAKGLLAPTTASLYKNGPFPLGLIHKSGSEKDKSTIIHLRKQLNTIFKQWIEEYKTHITPIQKKSLLDALEYVWLLRSDEPIKNPSDFNVYTYGIDEQIGDLHYRYFEGMTEADLRGFAQKLFATITGIQQNPYDTQNKQELQTSLALTHSYFKQWTRQLDAVTQIKLAGIFKFAINNPKILSKPPEILLKKLSPRQVINNTNRLTEQLLYSNRPYAVYPNTATTLPYDLKIWAETILLKRLRLYSVQHSLAFPTSLTPKTLASFIEFHPETAVSIPSVIFMVKQNSVMHDVSSKDIEYLLSNPFFSLLRVLKKYGLFTVQAHSAISEGMSLPQMSTVTIKKLHSLKAENGFIITRGETNYFSVDHLNIDTFRMLTVTQESVRDYLGLDLGTSILQFVPAGLSTVIGFGFTQQTAQDFSDVFKSEIYKNLLKKYADDEPKVLRIIQDNFQHSYLPIIRIAESLLNREKYKYGLVRADRTIRTLSDGKTILANTVILPSKNTTKLDIWHATSEQGNTLDDIRYKYEKHYPNRTILLITNGGFFITKKLIEREHLPDEVLGTTLGLSIREGRILSPPLFNKIAIFQTQSGDFFLHRATIDRHGSVWSARAGKNKGFFWTDKAINLDEKNLQTKTNKLSDTTLLYTPLYDYDQLPHLALSDRVIIQIAGNKIALIESNPSSMHNLIAGITLSIPSQHFDKYQTFYKEGDEIEFGLNFDFDISHVQSAIEAGPLLVQNGKPNYKSDSHEINFEGSGWLTNNSKKTQESKVADQIHRYARSAIGLRSNELVAVVIDGRIVESVGVTHSEMAQIMLDTGSESALALDGGGSSALYIPHLDNPAFNNNSWNKYKANASGNVKEHRKSMVRPLSTALIYYIDKEDISLQPIPRKIIISPQKVTSSSI